MDREKFYAREQFTDAEKWDISRKSDDRCCHCGKKKFFGYGATVDHFIPLYKGGSNRMLNLIMMCSDCNEEKGDKIVDLSYVPYLKDEYKAPLGEYLQNYISSFDYIGRSRLFACDQYSIILVNQAYRNAKYNGKIKGKSEPKGISCVIKMATENRDFERLCDYFEKYLIKNNRFGNREAVRANISFWLRFGCIYYLERNGEISVMVALTVKNLTPGRGCGTVDKCLNMWLFSYYSNETAYSLCANIVREFPSYILREQNLAFIPVNLIILETDRLALPIFSLYGKMTDSEPVRCGYCDGLCMHVVVGKDYTLDKVKGPDMIKVRKFFEKFDSVGEALKQYLGNNPDVEWNDWMVYDILTAAEVQKLGIFDKQVSDSQLLGDSITSHANMY